MDPLLVYVAGDLDTAGISVDRELPPEWLIAHLADVEVHADRPGHIEGRLSRSGTDNVVVRCDARAEVTVPCARCLRPASVELRGELSLLLRPGKVLPTPARAVREGEARANGKPKAAAPRANGDGKPKETGPGTQAVEAVKALRTARGAAGTRAPRRDVGGASGRGAHAGRTDRSVEARPDRRGERGGLPEYEFSAEEADHDLYDGETVILDEFVREALLLEMPNFPLCSEDCPGIGPVPADVGSSPDQAPSAPSPPGAPTGASEGGGEGADAARPPGTKSLGDVLRAHLAERSAKTPAAKKR